MRTVLIVLASWVLAGLVVVLMDRGVPGEAPAPRTAAEPAASNRANVPSSPRSDAVTIIKGIALPVSGISAADLSDTFEQARGGGRRHNAIDILAPRGTPVVAAVDGTIRKLFTSKAGGLTIYQFDNAGEVVYYYAHLDRYRDGLADGMAVKRGEVIGYVGVTGNAGNTPHLHFSIEKLPPTKEWWKGAAVNPYPILMGTAMP